MRKTFAAEKKKPAFPLSLFLWPTLFLASFEVYLLTLNPAFPNDDSAETMTAGLTLGLQHPPGYALAALLSRIQALFPIGSPSFRANMGSALLASLAVCLLALNLFTLLKTGWFQKFLPSQTRGKEGLVLFCAVVPAFLLAFSPAFWRNALGAKGGIYLLAGCLHLILLHFLLRHETAPLSQNRRWFLLSLFLLAVGLVNHWETQLVFIPGLLIFFWAGPAQGLLPPRETVPLIKILVFLLLGASPFLYLPLRAHLYPVLNLGAPDTWNYFMADLSRHYVADREVGLLGILGHVLNGTSTWGQWLDLLRLILRVQGRPLSEHLLDGLGLPTLLLALLGLAAWLFSKEKKILMFLLLSLACLFLSLLSALLIPDDPGMKWVLDNFLIPADWILALLAGVGMAFLLARLKRSPSFLAPFVFVLLGGLPFLTLKNGFAVQDQEKALLAYDYGENLLKSLPRDSIFFAEGDEDYFSFYYLQQVEHQRPDVRMIPAFTLFEPWGVEQIERRYPELGLTASSMSFPDHFQRISYALSEIVDKNRLRSAIGFSWFGGAFHRYYFSSKPSLLAKTSGILWLLDSPLSRKIPTPSLEELRPRHWLDCPANHHPSLNGIWDSYGYSGFFPD